MNDPVKQFINSLAAMLNIKFVRADQSGERIPYIFLSYKILSADPEPAQGIIVNQRPVTGDDTKIIKTSVRESELVVSLSFVGGEKDYSALWTMGENALNWIDSEAGSDEAARIGIGVSPAGPVQDRTVFFETAYEHRIGFDIKVKEKRSKDEKVDAVDIAATAKLIKEVQNG